MKPLATADEFLDFIAAKRQETREQFQAWLAEIGMSPVQCNCGAHNCRGWRIEGNEFLPGGELYDAEEGYEPLP